MARPRAIPFMTCILLGCGEPHRSLTAEVTLSPLDTIITTASGVLAKPTEVTVAEDGRIFIADIGASAIVVLGPEGDLRQTIGRKGAGPGEFERPRSMVVFQDTLMFIDGGQGRLAIFSIDGDFVTSRSLPEGRSSAVSLLPSRELLVALQGNDSALARRYRPDWTGRTTLGTPVAATAETWDFPAIKKDIAEGRVPAFLRNLALPVLGTDRSATLVMLTERQVLRFGPADSLEWTSPLDAPELDAILQYFFEQNRGDSNPARFHMLSYVTAAKEISGDLWLQLRTPPGIPGVILVLDREGRLRRRLVIPGAPGNGSFAVDPSGGLLYLIGLDDAVLLRTHLP